MSLLLLAKNRTSLSFKFFIITLWSIETLNCSIKIIALLSHITHCYKYKNVKAYVSGTLILLSHTVKKIKLLKLTYISGTLKDGLKISTHLSFLYSRLNVIKIRLTLNGIKQATLIILKIFKYIFLYFFLTKWNSLLTLIQIPSKF